MIAQEAQAFKSQQNTGKGKPVGAAKNKFDDSGGNRKIETESASSGSHPSGG